MAQRAGYHAEEIGAGAKTEGMCKRWDFIRLASSPNVRKRRWRKNWASGGAHLWELANGQVLILKIRKVANLIDTMRARHGEEAATRASLLRETS
jgi:hypothetical protein